MLIVEQTSNMPQAPMYKGFEACHVNRLIVFAQKPISFLGCLLKIINTAGQSPCAFFCNYQ